MFDDNKSIEFFNKEFGVGFLVIALVFYSLGILLFFDRACFIIANLCFLYGIVSLVGVTGAISFFFLKKGKLKGSILFFAGFLLQIINLVFIGAILQVYGQFTLFKSFLPFLFDSACSLPIIGGSLSFSLEDIKAKFQVAGSSGEFNLSSSEPFSLEIPILKKESLQIPVYLEEKGNGLGFFYINLPDKVLNNEETEMEDEFSISSSGYIIRGKYYLIIINRKVNPSPMIKHTHSITLSAKKEQRTPLTKSKTTAAVKKSTSKSNKSTAKKTKKFDLSSEMNKVLDQYQESTPIQAAEKDMQGCIYLNKLNNTDIKIEDIERTMLSRSQNEIVNRQELSPEKLKDKFAETNVSAKKTKATMSESKKKFNKSLDASGIENEILKYSDDMKNNNDYLKSVIFSMDSQMKSFDSYKRDNEITKIELSKSEKSRKELQETIKETTNEYQKEHHRLQQTIGSLLSNKNDSDAKMKELSNKFLEALERAEKAERIIKQKKYEEDEINLKNKMISDLRGQLECLNTELDKRNKYINELQKEFNDKIEDLHKCVRTLEVQKDNLGKDKIRLSNELMECKQILTMEQSSNIEKSAEVESLRRKFHFFNASEAQVKCLQEQKRGLERELIEARTSVEALNNTLENLNKQRSKANDSASLKHLEDISTFEKKIAVLEAKLREADTINFEFQKKTSELKQNISNLEQLLCIREDALNQLDHSNERVERLTRENKAFKDQVETSAQNSLSQNDQILDLQRILSQYRTMMHESEEYIINLKKLVLEMRERTGAYIPMRDDSIDKKLADYINSLNDPSRIRVLFIRESNGVYQFGTKKVYVKVEQDKIYGFRVGGGFIAMEEFIQTYLPLELEKLARQDPVKVLSKNLAIHKTIAGRCVNELEKSKITTLKPKQLGAIFSKEV